MGGPGGLPGIIAGRFLHAHPLAWGTIAAGTLLLAAMALERSGPLAGPLGVALGTALILAGAAGLERERARAVASASERRLLAGLAALPIPIVHYELVPGGGELPERLIGWGNPAWVETFFEGVSSIDELRGRPIREVFRIGAASETRMRRVLAGETVRETYPIETRQGPRRFHTTQVRFEGGILTVNVDVEERERAREELAATQARFHQAFAAIDDAVAIYRIERDERGDPLLILDWANPAWFALLARPGFDPENALGRPADEISYLRPGHAERLARLVDGEQLRSSGPRETRLGLRRIDTHLAPFGDGAIAISRDVEEFERAREATDRAERRLRAGLDTIGETVAVYTLERRADGTGAARLGWANRTWYETYVPPELRGTDLSGRLLEELYLFGPSGAGDYELIVAGERFEGEFRIPTARGLRWMEIQGTPYPEGMVTVTRDVTERRAAEEALRAERERFLAVFSDAPVGLATVGRNEQISDVNRSLGQLLGRTTEELVGLEVCEIAAEPDRLTVHESGTALVEGERPAFRADVRLARGDGETVWAELQMTLAGGEILLQAADLSERKRIEADLAERARLDPLTGLANRDGLDAVLDELSAGDETGSPMVAYVDLDGFKAINDTHGHEVGDRVLVAVAGRLARLARQGDCVARLGGDEFVLLMASAPPRPARLLERVRRAIEGPVALEGLVVEVRASVGLARLSPPDLRAAFVEADRAMYHDKAARQTGARGAH